MITSTFSLNLTPKYERRMIRNRIQVRKCMKSLKKGKEMDFSIGLTDIIQG